MIHGLEDVCIRVGGEESLMRLVIDMQGAQSASSRQRGIGRYTLALTQAMVRNRGGHEIFLCLNGLFPESIAVIRESFAQLLPPENIRVWQAPGPVATLNSDNAWRRRSAELIREAFLASLRPDLVLVSSLFEGLDENVVTSIGNLSGTVPTAAILYDLIPLVHRERYLENPVVSAWYEEKLGHLRRADLLLAISESSRQEAITHLDLSPAGVITVSTAADPQFRPMQVGAAQEASLRSHYDLRRPFAMYTGGIDHRKNIEGLIRAYALLPQAVRDNHQLAIVCSVQPAARAALEELGRKHGLKRGELVLTGFVPEEDLLALYNLCKVFVFPSWHEGFGLPALEAMACGRPVIGANTSSVPEVIGRADALFDPLDDVAITAKLEQVLGDEALRRSLVAHGLEQARRFSWDSSARRALAAFEDWHSRHAARTAVPTASRRLRLAYVSPLPPERSGISDYSAELIPALAEHYDIEVVVAQQEVSDPWISAHCPLRSQEWFEKHASGYDRILYQFGNSRFHRHMFDLLQRHPGVVTLHDFFLSGVLADGEQTGAIPGAWSQALYRSHGYAALRERCRAANTDDLIWRYPCNLDVLQNALGIIVHGENSRRLARTWYGEQAAANWAVISHLRVAKRQCERVAARRLLGLDEEDFVVCSFGILSPTKLNHRLLEAWLGSALANDSRCVLLFVGDSDKGDYGRQMDKRIRQSGLEQRIRITGWADTDTFRTYLAAADVGVQLRTLSRGETSGTVLDCMNYALATIVNAHGSMADLPPDAVWMMTDDFADAELRQALETLRSDEERRSRLAARGRELILGRHDPRACAAEYREAIETIYRCAATGRQALAQAVANLGPPPDAAALERVSQAIAATCAPQPQPRQLLVDVSRFRSAEGIPLPDELTALLENQPHSFRVEPVYLSSEEGEQHYRYARTYTCKGLGIPDAGLVDSIVHEGPGDMHKELAAIPTPVERSEQPAKPDRGENMGWFGKLPDRLRSVGASSLNWRQRLRRIPIAGRILAWCHAFLLLDATRRQAALRMDQLSLRQQQTEQRIARLEALGVGERLNHLEERMRGLDELDIANRLNRLDEMDIASRLNRLDAMDIANRLNRLDEMDIANRLNRLDEMNIAHRLNRLDEMNIAHRLNSLDEMNIAHRLNSLDAVNVGYRLNRLDALDIANRLHVFDLINIANRLNRLDKIARQGWSGTRSEADADAPRFDLDRFYVDFENAFRGDYQDIQARLSVYLPYLAKLEGAADACVVDVGCGRGEWLELLKEQGIHAVGIDLNAAMVSACQQRGLAAECTDAVGYLRAQPPGSLAAVTGFHIIEHLPFANLIDLFDAALQALRPGGLVIFETPNPENLKVGACNFYNDPTHRHPIVPMVAEFFARQRGFARAEILRLHPYPIDHQVKEDSEAARRINQVLYGAQDYAVLAWKVHAD